MSRDAKDDPSELADVLFFTGKVWSSCTREIGDFV
jgi:hypothetical protein